METITITTAAEAGSYFKGIMPYFIISLSFVFFVAAFYIKMKIAKMVRKINKKKQ